ncbi:MAG: HAL/PAL/TAL family ammonia-lyase [Alistipes onderdonkii]
MAQYRIGDADLNSLQYNIIRSHSCGAGEALPDICVRAAMLARLQTFLNAKSGVHPDVVRILADFLNNEIYPLVPRHGSVGASGDLVQLAHIALALIGEAEVSFRGETVPAAEAMAACGITPLRLRIRDGLALTNGTAVMTGIGLVNLAQARRLLGWAVKASVMLNEIVESYDDFMAGALNEYKLHAGQIEIARQMRAICATRPPAAQARSGTLQRRHGRGTHLQAQGAALLLAAVHPQILGPVLETISQAEKILVEEFNAVDDNPVVDPAAGTIYHGGNFHGDYVSLEMDKLKIAVTKMTMLAERQLNYLFHDRINETLPPFVNLGKLGLNYGLQAAQFTATSTTAESQTLSNPMYVHSIPNNNDNQDIVSMGTNAAMLTRQVVENGYQVAAIEMLALVQAADYLQCAGELSDATRQLYADIRGIVPRFADDTPKHREIAAIENFLKNNSASL